MLIIDKWLHIYIFLFFIVYNCIHVVDCAVNFPFFFSHSFFVSPNATVYIFPLKSNIFLVSIISFISFFLVLLACSLFYTFASLMLNITISYISSLISQMLQQQYLPTLSNILICFMFFKSLYIFFLLLYLYKFHLFILIYCEYDFPIWHILCPILFFYFVCIVLAVFFY